MGRLGVSYAQFKEAADHVLTVSAELPTLQKVRALLGTGSHSTLNPYMNRWKDEFIHNHLAGTKTIELPDPILRSIKEVWDKLIDESQQVVQHIQEECKTIEVQAREEKEDALNKVKFLEETNKKLEIKLNHLQADYELIQKTLADSKKQEHMLNERAIRLAENLQQSQELHQMVIKELNQNAVQRELRLEAEVNSLREDIEKQRHKWISENDALKINKNKIEQQVIRLESALKQQKEKYEELEGAKKKIEIDLSILTAEHEKNKKEMAAKEKYIIEWQSKSSQQTLYITELKDRIISLEQKLEMAMQQIGELNAKGIRSNKPKKR